MMQFSKIPEVTVRRAAALDLDELVALERAAWPDRPSMRASRETLAGRVALGGVWVARGGPEDDLIGSLTSFRPRWARAEAFDEMLGACPEWLLALPTADRWSTLCARYRLPVSWHVATDDGRLGGGALHDERSDVMFGISLAIDPRHRGRAIGSALLEAALQNARNEGARCFVGYGRLPLYHRHASLALADYVNAGLRRAGRLVPHDYGFRLHWSLGAAPLQTAAGEAVYQGIPGAMREDPESRDAGILLVMPLAAAKAPFRFERAGGVELRQSLPQSNRRPSAFLARTHALSA